MGRDVSLKLIVLGSSGMFATTERACAGYVVELGDKRIWMDAGTGTWRNLLHHMPYESIDGIMLTHRHPDHTSDVFQAFHARNYGQPDPLAPIPLWAPQETIDRIFGFARDLHESFELITVCGGETMEFDGATFTFVPMAHPPETVGIRVEYDGSVLAYSADTGPEANFEKLAGDADVFLCEATFQDHDELWEGHLSATQAGRIATEARVSKLLLTHLRPGRDAGVTLMEADKAVDGVAVQLASDGLRLEL